MPDWFETICQTMIARLQNELDPGLIYHNVFHTTDVMEQAASIATSEGVKPGHELNLLKTAAAYHDSGFLFTYKNHEEKGCEIARNDLSPRLTDKDIETVCGMIMATKIPQSPKNLLEEIICDADLDYLGRDDFEPISKNLYKEFFDFQIIRKEDNWDRIQINFFELHHYFTQSSLSKRNPKKQEHLRLLKERSDRQL
jgi:predicted metal-dependent HD superfamily phosphohydrolase